MCGWKPALASALARHMGIDREVGERERERESCEWNMHGTAVELMGWEGALPMDLSNRQVGVRSSPAADRSMVASVSRLPSPVAKVQSHKSRQCGARDQKGGIHSAGLA
jgi:hypothetical protein